MKNKTDAKKLAKCMQKIWKKTGKEITCVISKMNQPLGYAVGNTLEIIEVVEALHGKMQDDVREIVFAMCVEILKLSGKTESEIELKKQIWEIIDSGKALETLNKFVEVSNR